MKRLEKRKTLSNTQVKNLANAVNPVKDETKKEEGPKAGLRSWNFQQVVNQAKMRQK